MLSIIITAFKEPNVDKTIRSIIANNLPEDIEIVLSAPDKETIDLARQTYSKIKIFKDPGKGKSYALNLLFKKLKSDILILTDGDVIVSNTAISELLKKFKDPNIGCVSGRVKSINKKDNMLGYWSHLLADAGAHNIRKELYKKNKFLECTAYLFAFRGNVIKEIPLDVAEDAIIPYIFWKKDYKIAYSENALVYVKNPDYLKDFIKQRIRTAGAHSRLKFYHSDFPSIKSFKNEIRKGFLWALSYPKNIKEFFWTLNLFPIRTYIWLKMFYLKREKKEYRDGWERVESTKI